jgi:nucleoid DNA-binding protein
MRFHFAEALFDRIEVWRIRRQILQPRADRFDCLAEAIAAACKTIDRRWRLMGLPKEQNEKSNRDLASLFRRTEAQSRIFRGTTPVIKSELVDRVAAQNPHLYARDLEKVVNAILGEIVTALSRGDRVEIRGFGVFSIRSRRARTGRNAKPPPPGSLGELKCDGASGCYMVIDRKQEMFFVVLEQTPSERQRIQRTLKLLVYEAMAN